jgi:leader peptidase (prepilin peptidase)/N-methyltransferase
MLGALNHLDDVPQGFWYTVTGVAGLAIGSFLNVVIYRLPRGESIVLPASHCGSCDAKIRPYDNIPLVSFVLLGGRCRQCRARISIRYPLVEALTAALFVTVLWLRGPTLGALFDCVFVAMILPLVFVDLEHHVLPNRITHPGLLFALLARLAVPNLEGLSGDGSAVLFGLSDSPDWFVSLVGAAMGGTLGGGFLFVIGLLYELVRRREGMGLGDVAMMCMVGAYVGWQMTLVTIILASLVGSVVGVAAAGRKQWSEYRVPFGVFLGIGAVAAVLGGRRLVDWYLSLAFGA